MFEKAQQVMIQDGSFYIVQGDIKIGSQDGKQEEQRLAGMSVGLSTISVADKEGSIEKVDRIWWLLNDTTATDNTWEKAVALECSKPPALLSFMAM